MSTPLEKEALDTLREVCRIWTARQINTRTFMDTMGLMIQTIKHLENLETGCPTGSHAAKCFCVPAVKGHTLDWKYRHSKGVKNGAIL